MVFTTLMLLMKAGWMFPDSIILQTQSRSCSDHKATAQQQNLKNLSLPVLLHVDLQQEVSQGFFSLLQVERQSHTGSIDR